MTKRLYLVALLILTISLASAQTPMTFVHPGAVTGQADLDFVKAKIAAGEQAWLNAFNQMKGWARGGTAPKEYINSSNNNDDGFIDLLDCSSIGIVDNYNAYITSPKEVSPYGAFGSFIIATNIIENRK